MPSWRWGLLAGTETEVGVLVQTAFRKYNAAEEHEETNQPGALVPNSPSLRADPDDDNTEDLVPDEQERQEERTSVVSLVIASVVFRLS